MSRRQQIVWRGSDVMGTWRRVRGGGPPEAGPTIPARSRPPGSATEGREVVMPTIDAQVHAYERDHPGRAWAGHLAGPPEVTGEQMVAAMDAVGVDGAI